MRKLIPLPLIASLILTPAALAATDDQVKQTNAADGSPNADARKGKPIHKRATLATTRGIPTKALAPVAVPPALQAIAACESGGNPQAIGGGGLYRGKYQFSIQTWQATGGEGDPVDAPEPTQDRMAIKLYESSGPGQWPVCGQ